MDEVFLWATRLFWSWSATGLSWAKVDLTGFPFPSRYFYNRLTDEFFLRAAWLIWSWTEIGLNWAEVALGIWLMALRYHIYMQTCLNWTFVVWWIYLQVLFLFDIVTIIGCEINPTCIRPVPVHSKPCS